MVFSSLEMQGRLLQAKVCLRSNHASIFKNSSFKKPFLQCVCYLRDLLWWMFLNPYDSCKAFYLYRLIITLSFSSNVFCSFSFCECTFFFINKIFRKNSKSLWKYICYKVKANLSFWKCTLSFKNNFFV